ncbi:MAG: hypothetical protein K2X81_13915, partial [Candidatus Obscuribacterales bacterium]|nr:hypothetical protein [Candidatus Obscuribacterales bacterium]
MRSKIFNQRFITSITLTLFTLTQFSCAFAGNTDSAAKARADYNADDFKKAVKDCSEWLDKHPDDADIIRLRGKCFLA